MAVWPFDNDASYHESWVLIQPSTVTKKYVLYYCAGTCWNEASDSWNQAYVHAKRFLSEPRIVGARGGDHVNDPQKPVRSLVVLQQNNFNWQYSMSVAYVHCVCVCI